MRIVLFVLILAVTALILALATGLLNIEQTRQAQVPQIETKDGGVSARGGQSPAFDIETGSVSVGSSQRNVTVPTIEVTPANEQASAQNDDAAASE